VSDRTEAILNNWKRAQNDLSWYRLLVLLI
jgi:hypothetical protein